MIRVEILKSWEDRLLLEPSSIDITVDCNGDSYYDD